jgi:YbbR domain-containing protein
MNLSNGSNTISFTINTTGFNPGVKTLSLSLSIPVVGMIESNTTEFRINGIFVDLTSPETDLTSADTALLLNVTVRDEGGNHVTGLPSQNFTVKVDGNTTAVNLTEVSSGVYQANINVTGLSDGQHSLTIYVRDSRGITEYDQLTFSLTTTETQTINLTTNWNLISLPLSL